MANYNQWKNGMEFIDNKLIEYEKTQLEIIEIQTGEYLGEDDIVRLEDDYQRQ